MCRLDLCKKRKKIKEKKNMCGLDPHTIKIIKIENKCIMRGLNSRIMQTKFNYKNLIGSSVG